MNKRNFGFLAGTLLAQLTAQAEEAVKKIEVRPVDVVDSAMQIEKFISKFRMGGTLGCPKCSLPPFRLPPESH